MSSDDSDSISTNELLMMLTHLEMVGTSKPLSMLSCPAGTATDSSSLLEFGYFSLSLSKAALSSCCFSSSFGFHFLFFIVVVVAANQIGFNPRLLVVNDE